MILVERFADKESPALSGEAEAAAGLQHPNIVAIHEVGVHEGQHYFSMDYVEGQTWRSWSATARCPRPRPRRYVQSIAEAVHYAHERGILHRDLKPPTPDRRARPAARHRLRPGQAAGRRLAS